MDTALKTGIITLAETVTGLDSTNLFYSAATHSKSYPYCVFFGVDNAHSYDGGTQSETYHVQFTFYWTSASALSTTVEDFKSKFDLLPSSLTVAGYSVIDIRRSLHIPAQMTPENVWQEILEYSIEINKAR